MTDPDGSAPGGASDSQITRDSTATVRFDAIFDILRSAQRRYLLYHLRGADSEVHEFEDVVEAVRKYEDADPNSTEPSLRQEIRLNLVHNHLPRLESSGVLEYDIRQGTVRYLGDPHVEQWIEQVLQVEIS